MDYRKIWIQVLALCGSLCLCGVQVTAFAGPVQGESTTLTKDYFHLSDPDEDYSLWTFTVVVPPVNGSIIDYGDPSDNVFTYDDILNERVVYQHDGSETTSDSFILGVSDGFDTVKTEIRIINILPRVILSTGFE